jgi:hypothetical protein
MTERCVRKKNSIQPVCGVHGANLTQCTIPIDPNAPHIGMITCYMCPISQNVIQDDTIQRN